MLPGAYLACAKNGDANPASNYIRIAAVHEAAVIDEALDRIRRVL